MTPPNWKSSCWDEAIPMREPHAKKSDFYFKPCGKARAFFTTCGHVGTLQFDVVIQTNCRTITLLNPEESLARQKKGIKNIDTYCGRCYFESIKKFAIRCCFCGDPILPGDRVGTYSKSCALIRKEITTFVEDEVLGCMKEGCGFAGAFGGYWSAEGFIPAFPQKDTT
ncbi:MAG: hypothetical protein KGI50_04020 [Patescibacteria group bacterium]|nr:hypothetical protein [Patescibacteria group bacterium]MDE2438854.1 hypothetical protein [Patescibacteria group bacterium]